MESLARRALSTMSLGHGSASFSSIGVLIALGTSVLALASAPLLMPDSYSWVRHTTSESAAQGVDGAWLARLGFVLFGSAVLALCASARRHWGFPGTLFHSAFGLLMVATAVFSHRLWETETPFDRTEDLLHSITATGIGFAFVFGVLFVLLRSDPRPPLLQTLGAVALVFAVLIPLLMAIWADYAGLLQRVMFLIAYLWYGAEALRFVRGPLTGDR